MRSAARQGHAGAIAKLEALKKVECPRSMRQLVNWAFTLHGRSGATEGYVFPVSFTEIKAFDGMLDLGLEPHEVGALVELDGAMRSTQDKAPEPVKKPARRVKPSRT